MYRAFRRVFDSNRNLFAFDVDVEQRGDKATATARITSLPLINESCGLHLGDAIHNYRSALDHLVWDLVRIGTEPRPKEWWRVQFPMARSWASFKEQRNYRLPGVPDEHAEIIREYQPYRREEHPKAIRRLNRFSNMDKHRVLIPATMSMAPAANLAISSNWLFTGPPKYFIGSNRALKVNAKVMEIELIRSGTNDCQMKVDGYFPVYPSLGRGLGVGDALEKIDEAILSIRNRFDELI